MLTELYIRNLTLIEKLSLDFGPGLTVLTGETGAGKSILLDAILLVIGGRASIDNIRDGEKELDVSARFSLNANARTRIALTLEDLEMPPLEDASLLVRRVVARNGRHRQYVNGAPVTVTHLREIAEPLVDFTGQHAQHALQGQKGQIAFIDSYACHENLLLEVSRAHVDRKELVAIKRKIDVDERTRANRSDWLRFQIEEIEKCDPKKGELDELLRERAALLNASKINEEGARVIKALSEDSEGNDVSSRLALVSRSMHTLSRLSPSFQVFEKRLDEAITIVDEICLEVERALSAAEESPAQVSTIEDRIGDIKQLLRKHGDTIEEVLRVQGEMRVELNTLQDSEQRLEILDKKLLAANQRLTKAATDLSDSRKAAAAKLAPLVQKEIAELGMPEAIFEIEVSQNRDENGLVVGAHGSDSLRLLFSANPGESPNALEKVASGGEISRVMLGVKRVLMDKDVTMVSVFDEVDAGVGGSIAHAIGEKLKTISHGRQVLCVTHLAQVAALADAHVKVEKRVHEGRTTSSLTSLSKPQRIEELARMMGNRHVTELTRKHASEFLEQAGVFQ